MGLISLDSVICGNCQRTSLIRRATFEWPESDPKWTRKADPPQAFSCPACKHVYMLQALQQRSLEVTEEQWEALEKALVAFAFQAQCDDTNCETLLTVLAIRTSGTKSEDIQKEISTWTLHDLFCPGGHPVSNVRDHESAQESKP
jgi:Zn finger protein HypA/HybF involved in hydrogenase expression